MCEEICGDPTCKGHSGARSAVQPLVRWVEGVPVVTEPDRLYAVLRKPTAGASVGFIVRGANCNWKSAEILAHWPMPFEMSARVARRLIRHGELEL